MAAPDTPAVPARDMFLDVVRAVAITRVVVVHLLGPLGVGRWYNWLVPGMPLVFFVSGALSFASVDPHRVPPPSPRAFLRNRLTRLLVPYWVFATVLLGCGIVAVVVAPGARTALNLWSLPTYVVPFAVPVWSPAIRVFSGHAWFASNFIAMLLAAPWLARAYRRWRGWPLVLSGTYFVVVVALRHAGVDVPREAFSLTAYSVMFCAGFMYSDREWTPPRPALAAVVCAAAPVAVWTSLHLPGTPNRNPLMGLPVAVCWLGLALAARGPLRRFGARHVRAVSWVSTRTLTLYLWGWPTSRLAIRVADAVADRPSAAWSLAFTASALGMLAAAVALFSPVERWAAQRARGVTPPSQRLPAPG